MAKLFLLFLFFFTCCAEAKDVKRDDGDSLRPKTPQEFATFVYQRFVSVITGDYQEEECDLSVAGIEPLSFRRFYNHLGHKNPTLGHWNFFPEATLFYNFDYERNEFLTFKKYTVVGEETGSHFFCGEKQGNGFKLDSNIEKGFTGESGQNHPLNLTIHFDRHIHKDTCYYTGTIQEGNGGCRSFITDWVPYKNDIGDPNTPPYQARILEYRRPNGNILAYTYAEFNELFGKPKALIQPNYFVTSVTAYNRDKTKVLGTLTIDYKTGKINNITEIEITGSDRRKAYLIHHLREVQSPSKERPQLFDVVLKAAYIPNQPEHSYLYRWEKAKDYFKAPYLCLLAKNGVCLETRYDLKSKKVDAQILPVGINGKRVPIARYHYSENQTSVRDEENQTTLYQYDGLNRITAIRKYRDKQLLYNEENIWDSAKGNLTYKKIGNLTYSYIYDERHNPIHETITDGKESYTLYRTFSEDGFNLKLFETDGSSKITRYTYFPQTNLLTSEIVYEHNTPRKRTFHFYDDCAVRIKTLEDDGTTLDPNNLEGVTFRKITTIQPKAELPCLGLPEIVEEKTLDSTGQEILLRKVAYTYHASGQIEREDHYDAVGTLRFSLINCYNVNEQLTSSTDPEGNTTFYSYDNNYNLTGLTTTHHKQIFYDAANRPIEEQIHQKDGTILSTKKQYNTLNQVIATTDETGLETQYTYNILGQVTQILHRDGGIEKKEYDSIGRLIQEEDPNGNITRREYNFRGLPIAIHYADGTSEYSTYHPNGTLAENISKNGCITRYTYDIFEHPIKEETYSPDNRLLKVKTATYTPFCKLSETDEEGITTTYTYDKAGRKIAEKVSDRITHFSYDSLGRLHKIQTDDILIFQEYDYLDRETEVRHETGQGVITFQEKYRYDAEGNKTHTTTCAGVEEIQYNAHKLPVKEISPDGYVTQFFYTYTGCFVKITVDPQGLTKIEAYDPCRRLKSVQINNIHNQPIQAEEFFYDLAGNHTLAKEHVYEGTDYKKTIHNTWIYGINNRLEKLVEADLKETSYTYDSCGRLKTLIKPDKTEIHHTYDELGRLKTLQAPNIHYQYHYDKKDRVLSVDDHINNTTTEKKYDPFGHVTEEKLANGYLLKYAYTRSGQLSSLTLPDATTATFHYKGDTLSGIQYKGQTLHYEKNSSGKPIKITLPERLGQLQFTYDSCLRLKSAISPFYTALDYQYDPTGHLLSYTFTDALGPVSSEFAYDDLHQLISENAHHYTYDSLHNRISKDSLHHTLNTLSQVTHDGEQDYIYDANGNLIQAGETQLSYDALDRLIQVTKKGETYTYSYDSLNRRISKKTPKETIHYLWQGKNEIGSSQGDLRILGEGLGAEIGAAAFIQTKNELYVPLHDHRGALVTLVTLKGKPAETIRYTAFGEELTQSNLSSWRFCSKRLDPETGYLYFGRRYYSPHLGRWITTDPQGFADGPNLYAYVHNNPLSELDFYGEMGEPWRYWTRRSLFETANFAAPCAVALYNLPSNAPLWKRGVLAFGAVAEGALWVVPPAKAGVSLVEKAIFQVTREALARQAERQILRTAEKTTLLAAANKIINNSAKNLLTRSQTAKFTPDFIVGPKGTVFPVPKGAVGPIDVFNRAGKKRGVAFVGGNGGTNKKVVSIRLMNPTPASGKSPGYPTGYVKYENISRQGVDPYTGKTLSHAEEHFAIE